MEKVKPRKVLSVKEFQAVRGKDLVVEKSKNTIIGPESKDFADCLHLVNVTSVKDLQEVGMLSRKLDAAKLVEVVRADDDEATEVMKKNHGSGQHDCDCHDKSHAGSSQKTSYRAMRKSFHPNLTRFLSEQHRKRHAWDDVAVVNTWAWVSRFVFEVKWTLYIIQLNNIVVNPNATLTVNSGTDLLVAHDVKIHQAGKIMVHSSYLKLKCTSIQGNL